MMRRDLPTTAAALALLWAAPALHAQEASSEPGSGSGAPAAPHADFPAGHTEHMVEMRDGVKLATSVYLPEGRGPWPAVLARTPYDKESGERSHRRYVEAGYAYVIQDQRGRFRSEGEYNPHENELHDGYDTVEWIARRLWSDGRVGITGASAVGIAANLAAAADPPHLEAAFVRVAPRSLLLERAFIGGMFKEAHIGGWMRGQGVGEEYIREYKSRVVEDRRWRETDLIYHRHEIDVAIYNAGGWYDLFSYGTVMNFQYLQRWGREGAKGNQKLWVGPVGHGDLEGDLAYPDAGDGGVGGIAAEEEIRFFDYWLKGVDNGIMDEPPVRYYMMAAAREGEASEKNGWRTAEQWPPTASTRTRYYLRPDRSLTTAPPAVEHASTSYEFDPSDPVPTVGGLNLRLPIGPMDQREITGRDDYLRFETPPLEEDVAVAGKIDFRLCAATDGPDTDFVVKLVDVYPDGYEALVLDTGLRTRYRHGRRPENVMPMTPGEPTEMTVDLWNSAVTFEEGHRIAVHVTSSNHPRFDVNPNTGEPPAENTVEPRVATNTVYHDASCPSYLILPVLEE